MKSNNKIIENYRNNEIMRNEFHNFISKVFPSISFKEWYSKGFWTENYIPFSIIESGKLISSASATFMNTLVKGKKCKAIQLGAVGTLPEYRNRGLSHDLINYVIKRYKDEVHFFFLHANETVLEFYPKFGFRSVKETVFVAESSFPESKYLARKLNIEIDSDYLLLQDIINNRQILTKIFGAEDYGFITMWHVLNFYQDNLYYLEKENVIVIKEEKNNTVHIVDVIYSKPFDFQLVLPQIMESNSIKSINYYFPPDQLQYDYSKIVNEKSGLFLLGDIEIEDKLLKFPETAHT